MSRSRRIDKGVVAAKPLRNSMHRFAAAVVRLSSVDPVTTELVRMRCARHHDCVL